MQPQQPSQIPPSKTPVPPAPQAGEPGHDPYHFIMSPPKTPKAKLLSGQTSLPQRLLLATCALVILVIVGTILIKVIGSSGAKTDTSALSALALKQSQLIQLSSAGVEKAQSQDAKNLAITAQASLTSDQVKLLELLQKNHIKVDSKQLAATKNTQTDAQLTAAESAGTFDKTFTELMQTQLSTYSASLKQTFNSSTSSVVRQLLNNDYAAAQLLLQQAKPAS